MFQIQPKSKKANWKMIMLMNVIVCLIIMIDLCYRFDLQNRFIMIQLQTEMFIRMIHWNNMRHIRIFLKVPILNVWDRFKPNHLIIKKFIRDSHHLHLFIQVQQLLDHILIQMILKNNRLTIPPDHLIWLKRKKSLQIPHRFLMAIRIKTVRILKMKILLITLT